MRILHAVLVSSGIEDSLPGDIDLPKISPSTAAGIGVAIAGNVLISLALNCQKLAHRRLERECEAAAHAPQPLLPTHADTHPPRSTRDERSIPTSSIPPSVALETVPLLERGQDLEPPPRKPWFFFRRSTTRIHAKEADRTHLASTHALVPVDDSTIRNGSSPHHKKSEKQPTEEANYLKSKLWWLGFLLMNIGELGNFISYAFAPASLVAPLGTFALIANCVFAPLMLKERFRKRDFLGIIIAIIGAVTVVLSANPSDTRLDPKGLIAAITQRPFEIYALTYVVGIIILSGLSEGPAGKRVVYVDVGLCALFGGFTVLSTKAFSTLLTMEWFEIFTEWITYPIIAILAGTGIGQIKYLNRALMRFDSKIVVPTQFVMFNLSAIVGSAILYGDFKQAKFHQLVTFLYGCGATFAGVFIIAWSPAERPQDEPEEEEDEDDTFDTGTLTLASGSQTPAIIVAEAGGATPGDERSVSMSIPASRQGSVRKTGSVARRRPRAVTTLAIPDGGAVPAEERELPVLRNRHSIVSLYGFSPAQRVLLISSSPRDEFVRPPAPGTESDGGHSPDSAGRMRRAVNWLDEDFGGGSPRQTSPQTSPRRYGATVASRDTSRVGERVPAPRGRSRSPDPFL